MPAINAYKVVNELRNILEDDPDIKATLSERSKEIGVNRYMNEDAGFAPWIGVYLRKSSVDPNTMPKGFKKTITIGVVIQNASFEEGACTEGLEQLLVYCEDAIMENLKLRTSVNMVNNFSTEYTYLESDRESLYFQMAIMTLEVEARQNARS